MAKQDNQSQGRKKAHQSNMFSRLSYIGKRFRFLAWIGYLFYPIWWLLKKSFDLLVPNPHQRKLNKRRRRSNWTIWRARFGAWLRRREAPIDAHMALAIPTIEEEVENAPTGFSRLVTITALSSVAILALLVLYLLQIRPSQAGVTELAAEREAAGRADNMEPVETVEPTVTPTPTATPSPTPIIIQLTPHATIDPLAGGGSVVYAMHKSGNTDLYALTIGQEGITRLTTDGGIDEAPAWSPNGRQIAFTSNRKGNDDVYVLDMQNGEIVQMTTQPGYDGNPSWSPDGQWLVYESYQNENLDIYILRTDLSKEPIRITENPGPDFGPDWSPDGREIIWSGMRQHNYELWLMSLDSVGDSRAINLTNTAEIDETNPQFNFDGDRLAWNGRVKGGNFDQIMFGNLGGDRRFTSVAPVGEGNHPAWSPAGQSLVWSSEGVSNGILNVGAVNSFGIVPQSFLQDGIVRGTDWTAVSLASQPAGWLIGANQTQPIPLYTETLAKSEQAEDTEEEERSGTIAADIADAPLKITLRKVTGGELGFLSDSVDQSFLALRSRIEAESGVDLLGEVERMFVPLNGAPQPGEHFEIWHRAGRAFDINGELALGFSPILEIVRRDVQDETYWEVYVRTEQQDGSQGRPMTTVPWDFRSRFGENPVDYDEGGRLKNNIPTGYYVNLTTIARDYGWEPVPADRNWRTFYPGVRFWQFEKRDGLTFNEAMLELYDANQLENR